MPPAGGLELRAGWRAGDSELEADAVAFWKRTGILPPGVDPAERAKELVAGCYKDGRLVAVTTGVVEDVEFLRARFVVLRGAVDPELRRSRAGATMAYFVRGHLEGWARDHPDERLAGLLGILESSELAEIAREPYWPATRFILAGFMPDGRQVRVSWFDHYRLG